MIPLPGMKKVFETLKIEFAEEADSVSLGVHTEHPLAAFALDLLNLHLNTTSLIKAKGQIKFDISANAGLADLANKRSCAALARKGFRFNFDVKSNADGAFRSWVKDQFHRSYDEGIRNGLLTFLLPQFSVQMSADEFKALFWDCDPFNCCGLSDAPRNYEGLKNELSQIPGVKNVFDLVEGYLVPDVHLSFNTPHLLISAHVKTSGVKEFWNEAGKESSNKGEKSCCLGNK